MTTTPKPPARNVGGSLLPSSSPAILEPVATRWGALQVRVIASEDTHGLFRGDTLLAKHPNGYSCHALAKRLHGTGHGTPAEQADYIVACGGTVTPEGRALIAEATP